MDIAEQVTQLRQDFNDVKQAGYDEGYRKGIAEGGGDNYYDTYWNTIQQNGKRIDYGQAFKSAYLTNELLNIKFPINFYDEELNKIGSCNQMFKLCGRLSGGIVDFTEICKKIDFSRVTSAVETFNNIRAKNIDVDFSNCTELRNTFNLGEGGFSFVDNIRLKVSSKCSFPGTFAYASSITDIQFTEGSEIGNSISFANSATLTSASVQSIIDALMPIPEGGTPQTITFHQTVRNNLTTDQVDTIKNVKGWSLIPINATN